MRTWRRSSPPSARACEGGPRAGSNDLTQLVLGIDRNSEIVAHIFDERSPAVMEMIAAVIRSARARGRAIGICGQAPGDYPEFVRFLVEQRIDSIPLNPGALLKTLPVIAEAERARRCQTAGASEA